MRKYSQGRKIVDVPMSDIDVYHAHSQGEKVDDISVYRLSALATILSASRQTIRTAQKMKDIKPALIKNKSIFYYLDETADALEEYIEKGLK
jgi:hypothetical protein